MNDMNKASYPQELVSELRRNYQAFLEDCEGLTPEQAIKGGVCGEWSAKAVVDHLIGWQEESLIFLRALLSSENPVFDVDIDAFNQTSVKNRQGLSWKESLVSFKDSFEVFEQALKEIPISQFQTNAGVKSWVKAMDHEYQLHRVHIQQAQGR